MQLLKKQEKIEQNIITLQKYVKNRRATQNHSMLRNLFEKKPNSKNIKIKIYAYFSFISHIRKRLC